MSSPEPITCTLTPAGATNRLVEWEELRQFASNVEASPTGARLTLPQEMRGRVDDLVARERTCCSFLTIVVESDHDALVVAITSVNPEAQVVIAALTGLHESA